MTREEAIDIIKYGTEISKYPSRLTLTVAEVEEAKQMAIQALSQEPCDVSVSEKEPNEITEEVTLRFFKNSLKVRWHDFVIYNVEWLKKNWQMEMDIVCGVKPCDDAVSRRDAYGCLTFNGHYDTLNEVYERLSKLPSVTPKSETVTEFADRCRECGARYGKMLKQKSGKWIETEYHRWRCSVCREKGMSEWDNIHDVRTNFCPNCGAKMESEEQE